MANADFNDQVSVGSKSTPKKVKTIGPAKNIPNGPDSTVAWDTKGPTQRRSRDKKGTPKVRTSMKSNY